MAFPVEEKFIVKAELELAVRFPDSFRAKMMKNNGESVQVEADYFTLHPFYDTSAKTQANPADNIFCRIVVSCFLSVVEITDNKSSFIFLIIINSSGPVACPVSVR